MKIKTSITLSSELIETIDARIEYSKGTRSQFIETAVRFFIRQMIREEQDRKDLEIINRRAEALNREAADVLTYQAPL